MAAKLKKLVPPMQLAGTIEIELPQRRWPASREELCELLKTFFLRHQREAKVIHVPDAMRNWIFQHGSFDEWQDAAHLLWNKKLTGLLGLKVVYEKTEFYLEG